MDKKFIPLTYDKMFKMVLLSKEARSYLIDVISLITKIPKDSIKKNITFKNNEHRLSAISEKKKISDLVVDVGNGVINIEMNKDYYDGLLDRNHDYISKIRNNIISEAKTYKDMKRVIQINFDDFNIYKDKTILKFEMRDESGIKEGVALESYHVVLPNVRKKYYNKNADELIRKLGILVMKNNKELEKLIEENMELRPVGKKMIEISRDEELQGIYDGEEHERKVRNTLIADAIEKGWYEGEEKGIEKGKRQSLEIVVKRMLKEKINIEIIEKISGLSKREINDIENNM